MEMTLLIQQWTHTFSDVTFLHCNGEDGVITTGEGVDDLTGKPGRRSLDDRHSPTTLDGVHTGETVNTAGGELACQPTLAIRQNRDSNGSTDSEVRKG